MASLLPESLEGPEIAPPQQTAEPMRPKRQQLNPYTGVPHVQYYGYAISPDWLIELAEQHCPEASLVQNPNNYRGTTVIRAFEHIRQWTGIYTLSCPTCFNHEGDSVPPEWVTAMHELDDEDDPEDLATVQVLALCSD